MSPFVRVAALALPVLVGLALASPAAAQSVGQPAPRLGIAPDPIGQSRSLSERPLVTAPAPPPPAERLVPERRVFVPGTNREIVVPAHHERRITDQQYQAPPLIGIGPKGEIVHIPGGDRPSPDTRQAP